MYFSNCLKKYYLFIAKVYPLFIFMYYLLLIISVYFWIKGYFYSVLFDSSDSISNLSDKDLGDSNWDTNYQCEESEEKKNLKKEYLVTSQIPPLPNTKRDPLPSIPLTSTDKIRRNIYWKLYGKQTFCSQEDFNNYWRPDYRLHDRFFYGLNRKKGINSWSQEQSFINNLKIKSLNNNSLNWYSSHEENRKRALGKTISKKIFKN